MPSRPVRPPTATARSPGKVFLNDLSLGNQSHVAAIDQRVAQIPFVEIHGPVNRGNAHAVAVVAYTGYHALHHTSRMQHAAGQRSRGAVSGGAKQKTSVLQIGLAPMPVPMGSRITPPMPVLAPPYGSRAEGWLWVSTLKTMLLSSSKRTTPALSFEHANAPIGVAGLFADFNRGGKDGFLEHVFELPLALGPIVAYAPGQSFVAAMLAPGLRDGFQLGVGRVAVEFFEMVLDGLHLGNRQE